MLIIYLVPEVKQVWFAAYGDNLPIQSSTVSICCHNYKTESWNLISIFAPYAILSVSRGDGNNYLVGRHRFGSFCVRSSGTNRLRNDVQRQIKILAYSRTQPFPWEHITRLSRDKIYSTLINFVVPDAKLERASIFLIFPTIAWHVFPIEPDLRLRICEWRFLPQTPQRWELPQFQSQRQNLSFRPHPPYQMPL